MDVDKLILPKPIDENKDIQDKHWFSWFEEKGLINKLRAQIREQMICTLKDPMQSAAKTNVTSLKVQAINLLVAEFLMNQENLFTLSVLITEVSLLGDLREFSSYVNRLGSSTQNKPVTKPRFQFTDVQDILEALGVQPDSDISQFTCQYYFNDSKNEVHSLLACLFKAITTIRNSLSKCDEVQNNKYFPNKSIQIEGGDYEHRLNSWLVSVEEILSSFNLSEGQRNILKKLLKKYHTNNIAQEIAVYKEHIKKLENQHKEMLQKLSEVEQMLTTHFPLSQVINMFEEKENSMQEKIGLLKEEYKTKLQVAEKQNYELMETLKHEKILKEELMKQKDETKIIETSEIKLLQEQNVDLAKQLQEIKSKLDVLEEHKKSELTSSKKIESSLDREMVKKLQKENDDLREFIKVQRQRIEDLSDRINLAKQLGKTYQVPQTSIDYQTKNVRKKLHFIDGSNKKNRQNISSTNTDHSTTVLESDNQTDGDILKEAHSRLKMLEMKTAKVEQNLKNFQTNCIGHSSDYKVIKVNRNAYKKIRPNLSEDSDSGAFKDNSKKINLKELANRIGYHRSVRRSMNNSQSEIDTSPEILRNIKSQNYTNVVNISPIKLSSSSVNNINKDFPVNRPNSKINSPINRINDNELSMNKHINISTQLPNESQSFALPNESTVLNRLLPETNSSELINSENRTHSKTINLKNSNVEMRSCTTSPKKNDSSKIIEENNVDSQLFNHTEIINLPTKPAAVLQEHLNGVDTSSMSKREQSDQTISLGSNNTDKSSDFWA